MTVFKTIILFNLVANLVLAQIPEDWKKYIAPDMLAKYESKSTKPGVYSSNYFQGDILGISKELLSPSIESGLNNAINDQKKRWPNGIVPFELSPWYLIEDRISELRNIQLAMKQITSSTSGCIRFINRTTEENYLFIGRGMGCNSHVGMQGGKQTMSLDVSGCLDEIGSIQHELMHALGFYHEISRSDRDKYIWINWRNIQENFKKDFEIETDSLDFGIKYDYDSVLHYPYNAFAANPNSPTIVPKKVGQRIGQSDGLSLLDIVKLQKAYDCPGADDIITDQRQATQSLSVATTPKGQTETQALTTSSTASTLELKGQTAIQPQTTSSMVSNLELPVFSHGSLTDIECQALNTGHCYSTIFSNCVAGFFYFFCESLLTNFEIRQHLEQVKAILPSSPIWFGVGGKTNDFKSETFLSVTDNIYHFTIAYTDNFDCDSLKEVLLPNLLEFSFFQSTRITIKRDSLQRFRKVRSLYFQLSTIAFLEKGVLESLVSLKIVAFDWGITPISGSDQREHLWRLHCSQDYTWLRAYLRQHAYLIQPRKQGEIYSLPGVDSFEWTRRSIYYPVDCSNSYLTGDINQIEFSVNEAPKPIICVGKKMCRK